ncbi:iron-containing alcohol dehydrogenase [Neobacillus kokaensis]|uniref:1,3-propanediol dehydrogenase n=1 Tax=Neobacillus kokaensis TaxID=2759023 RepID=A0ABQ3N9W6_9BACI|nr:iron-containing alcohol dehydrogenase [Neobacillus kokaensis]GHI00733.1 1,3-propanediol dehydrogenase [Neobacillus kokaensis]
MSLQVSRLDLPCQMHAGKGSLKLLHDFVITNGGSRVLVIMDSFLGKPPINLDEKVKSILKQGSIESVVFSEYSGEPTTEHVHAALEILRDFQADCVVGIGGGSALDLSKAVSLFGKTPNINWTEIPEKPFLKRLPLIAVPTTAGTGSEATKVMVITNTETNIKMNPGHPDLIPDAAILDSDLTLSLPRTFTAYTGLDALTHAIEAFVSTRATNLTDFFALEAIRMIGKSLPLVCENGQDQESREKMSLASCYAGIAFSNASTNLVHAAGRSLGARFHIPHGLSVALLLPFVMRFGLEAAEHRYAAVAVALGANPSLSQKELAETSLRMIEDYNDQFDIWTDGQKYINLQDLKKEIPLLSKDAMSGNGIATNMKVPTIEDISEIYEKLINKLSYVYS